jgi:hypothetical protein
MLVIIKFQLLFSLISESLEIALSRGIAVYDAGLTQQPVIMEYVTERFINQTRNVL